MNETQGLDRDAFRRVWQRVMPEDRADCPFTVDSPAAVPAVAQAPNIPAGGPNIRPTPPAVRPPQRPGRPPICLGEDSRGELPTLERLIEMTSRDRRTYRAYARRWPQERLFGRLAEGKAEQLRKLTTARFLIDGHRQSRPEPSAPGVTLTLSQALRGRHRAEQEAALTLLREANAARDPCLIELYRALAVENQGWAKRIRERLERGNQSGR